MDIKQPNRIAKVLVSKRYLHITSPQEMAALAEKI